MTVLRWICSGNGVWRAFLSGGRRYSGSGQSEAAAAIALSRSLNSYLERRLDQNDGMGRSEAAALASIRASLGDLLDEQQDLREMSSEGGDLADMAEADLRTNLASITGVVRSATALILPEQKYDHLDATLEVLPGAGGMEASIFAEEMFTLYTGYANDEGMVVEVDDVSATSTGGVYRASARIRGDRAFQLLKYECGVHRVQRVPTTGSKSDRLQTSTCSVAVLPAPKEREFSLPQKELKFEYVRSSGAGGQSVNTSDSACRVTHVPTGKQVKCQEERSPTVNRERALRRLTEMLFREEFEEKMRKAMKFRKSQIGNMDRNEKIRTYNFSRNALSDHRISEMKQVQNLSAFLRGDLGFDVLRSLRTKLEDTHCFRSLGEYLAAANHA